MTTPANSPDGRAIDFSALPDTFYPVIPWSSAKPDYSGIEDKRTRVLAEMVDKLAFEVDQMAAQLRYLRRME